MHGFQPAPPSDPRPARADSTLREAVLADKQVQNYAQRDRQSPELHKCRRELLQEGGQLRAAVMAYLTEEMQNIIDRLEDDEYDD